LKIKGKLQVIWWGMLALLPIAFILLFTFVILHSQNASKELSSVLANGQRTTGTIISSKVFSDSEGDTISVKYVFSPVAGEQQSGHYNFYDTFGKSFWDELDVGDQVKIAYDQYNPDINVPIDAESQLHGLMPFIWFGFALNSVFMCILTFFLGRKAWNVWKLNKYQDCLKKTMGNQLKMEL
jgi:hypothetical protein